MKTRRVLALYLFLLTVILSCDPSTVEPCDLSSMDGSTIMGQTLLCNTNPDLTVTFESEALVEVIDSLIKFTIVSVIASVEFMHIVELKYTCASNEPDIIIFNLFDLQSGEFSGEINQAAVSVFIDYSPCQEASYFWGPRG